MLNDKIKPVALAVGTAFAATMAMTAVAETDGDLFAAEELEPRYDLLADAHGDGEGSCGEGSCGAEGDDEKGDDDEGSCGEGSCGAEGDDEEGSCGEGSCGEDE